MIRRIIGHPIYELFYGFLALIVTFLIIAEMTYLSGTKWGEAIKGTEIFVVILFSIDYLSKLWLSENKWHYIKTHPIELISCIPFSSLFQVVRIVLILRFIQALIIFNRSFKHIRNIFGNNVLLFMLFMTTCFIIIMSIGIYIFEPETFNSYEDALWWAYVTATTVGYGDFYPVTTEGRIIGGLLMTMGIGLVASMSGVIVTYMMRPEKENTEDATMQLIYKQLDNLDILDEKDIGELNALIKHAWERKSINK